MTDDIDLNTLAYEAAMWRAHEARHPRSDFIERAVLVSVEEVEHDTET